MVKATRNDLMDKVLKKTLTTNEQSIDVEVVDGSGIPVTGAVTISDGGGSITVDGTVTNQVAYGNSVFSGIGSATANNTTAGTALCSIASSELPAGLYQIDVFIQMPTITNASVSNLIEVRVDSTSLTRLITHIVAQNSGAYQPKTPFTFYRRLTGSNGLSLNFAVNCAATETQAWLGQITATKIAN